MLSSSRDVAKSNCQCRCYAVDFLMRSSPTRMVLIASHASFAVSLLAMAATISDGTALARTSSAIMSSWGSMPPGSTAAQSARYTTAPPEPLVFAPPLPPLLVLVLVLVLELSGEDDMAYSIALSRFHHR